MSLPTQNDVQAIEPILTNLVIGYMQKDARFVARDIFPGVNVEKDSGTYYIFPKNYWMRNEMKQRAAGSAVPTAGFGLSTGTYGTVQWALQYPLADEVRANSLVPLSLEQAAAKWLAMQVKIRQELDFASTAMTTSVWTTQDNNSTTDWDDFLNGDPITDIITGKSAISKLTGQLPNTFMCGELVDDALINHPDVIDRVKYVAVAGVKGMVSAVAQVLGVDKYLVARGVYTATNEQTADASITTVRIIDDDALLCYAGGEGILDASAGKTFLWGGGGGDATSYRVRDDEQHRDLFQTFTQFDHAVTAADMGAIWLDVV